MSKSSFETHLRSSARDGSHKVSSYLKAFDHLEAMLAKQPLGFEDCQKLWQMNDINRLMALRTLVREQQGEKDQSVWNLPNIPSSYLQNGFCSAALTAYIEFLTEHRHSEGVVEDFLAYDGPEEGASKKLERDFSFPKELLEELKLKEGRDVERKTKARANQAAFRKIILLIYQGRCCVTGLNIPTINRASHIIPWAEDKSKRLDPRNGLCLSATYDAAFDKHLISLDDEYRLILSKELKEHHEQPSVREHFLGREGQKIELPEHFLPHPDYLAHHRNSGKF